MPQNYEAEFKKKIVRLHLEQGRTYKSIIEDELRLRLSLLNCGNISVMTEAASIRFNAPKLFLEEG